MAGQGGLDADAMWAELKKADSSKIIDASHIPTSVLDGRWVTLSTNQTITGQKTFTQNILFSNNITGIRNTAGNLVFGAGNETIFCILNDYVGPVEAKNNQLVLGNDVGYWKKVTAGQYISKVATGVSPLIVSSNTLVNNLNSNYLEGYNNLGFIHSNYSASTGGATYVSGDTHIMLVAEINIDTAYGTYVILLSNVFWGHQHYSALQLHIACTNNDNSGNKSPRCSVHVMSLVGSHARGVRYKIENNKAYIFIEVYGGNGYGRWASTILQNYNRITTDNANTTGNIKLKFAFNQANSGLTAASYDNYINAASLAASRTLWGQPFNGTANVSGNMTGVGSINMSGQLTSTVASGVAPFIVVSNTVVGNLNADLLDGLHEYSFLRYRDTYGIDGYNTLWAQIGIRQYNDAKPDGMANPIHDYGAVISLPGKNTRLDIWYNHTSSSSDSPTNGIQYRSGFNDDKRPWRMLLDSVNYASYSDGRYVKKAGDTMTGDLNISGGHILYMLQTSPTSTQQIHLQGGSNDYGRIAFGGTAENAGWMEIASCNDGNEPIYARQYTGVFTTIKNTLTLLDANGDTVMSNNKGLKVGWGSRQVRQGDSWVHGGGDAASVNDANLRFGSRFGIGWYPTISGQPVEQGKNAMWLNVRNGNLDTHGAITAHTNYLAANWDSARRLVLGGGSSHAWIDSRNSSNNVLCNIVLQDNKVVIGNYAESSRFASTVGTGTQPYQCNSTTLNTNLNADLLDGQHGAYYQNRKCDGFVAQYNNYDYIEFLRFVIPSGQTQLRAYVVFDLCRVETGGDMNGRAVLRIRRGGDNNAGCIFYVTNFGRSWLPELRCTTDDGITWRVWMKCVKDIYDPYIAIKIVEQYPYGYVTTQNNGTTGTPGGSKYTFVAGLAGLSNAANIWTNARTFYIQDHNASHTGAGVSVNGSANVYLKLPNSIQCSDWFRSTGNSGWYHQDYGGGIYMQDSTYVRVYGGKRFYVGNTENTNFSTNTAISTDGGIYAKNNITSNANIIANGTVTAKASSSDIRLKTDIQGYDAMGIIRKFRSVKYHWNAIAKENSEVFNHDNWNYGLIAQDLLSGGYSQWVKDAFNDYYTIDYERLIPVVWKGLQEVDDEVTRLKKRVKELEKRLGSELLTL